MQDLTFVEKNSNYLLELIGDGINIVELLDKSGFNNNDFTLYIGYLSINKKIKEIDEHFYKI